MKMYRVAVTVVEKGVYDVFANSPEEALARAEDIYEQGNICWMDSEITDTEVVDVVAEKTDTKKDEVYG